MGKTLTPAFSDPLEIIRVKGRTYVTKKWYVKLQVFTMWFVEADLLKTVFGGNHYPLKNGFVWILSSRDGVVDVVKKLKQAGKIPTKHLLEEHVADIYKETNAPS